MGPLIPHGLPRDGPRGQITHVLRRGQNRLFREAGRGCGAGRRGGGGRQASAKAPRASDPHTGLPLGGNCQGGGGPAGISEAPLSCALLEVDPLTLPPHRPSLLLPALVPLLCGKPFSQVGFLSAGLVYFIPSIFWKEDLPHGNRYTNK